MQARPALSDDEWRIAKMKYRRGTHVDGTVLSRHPFGFFVDLGASVNGLVELPDDFPAVGTPINGVVVDVTEHNRQIRLSMRPSDLARDDWTTDRE